MLFSVIYELLLFNSFFNQSISFISSSKQELFVKNSNPYLSKVVYDDSDELFLIDSNLLIGILKLSLYFSKINKSSVNSCFDLDQSAKSGAPANTISELSKGITKYKVESLPK